MRTTIVPAQITTVEDRIMGSLGFSQLLLLVLPLFVGFGLFMILPPFHSASLYKYVIIGVLIILSSVLAIRVRGKIILSWLVTIMRYNLRPGIYVFDKNTSAYRIDYEKIPIRKTKQATNKIKALPKSALNQTSDLLNGLAVSDLRFEVGKNGDLRVFIKD